MKCDLGEIFPREKFKPFENYKVIVVVSGESNGISEVLKEGD